MNYFVFMDYCVRGGLAVQCFICHASIILPEWICIYGFPACVIYYAATKSFLYGFFLERAKCVRFYVRFKFADLMYDKLLPGYIGLYFLIYFILAPTFFRGIPIDSIIDVHVSIMVLILQTLHVVLPETFQNFR